MQISISVTAVMELLHLILFLVSPETCYWLQWELASVLNYE